MDTNEIQVFLKSLEYFLNLVLGYLAFFLGTKHSNQIPETSSNTVFTRKWFAPDE
jgi:hypothetical protein